MKSCGKKAEEKLTTSGIRTVGDLMDISDIDNHPVPDKMTSKAFKKLWQQVKENGIDAMIPPTVDHRTSENPYRSKFGDEWRRHIMKSQTFSHCEGIWNYVEHMMTESANVMKGTIHEDSWMIYHDALSLMTASRTKE